MNSNNIEISFRPIEPRDVANLVRWQRDPEVARWYWDVTDLADDELAHIWTRRATSLDSDSDSGTDWYIIEVDGHDIGEIQVANLDDYPETAVEVNVPNAAGVDVFIGEPSWRGRGIGSQVVRTFIDRIVFSRTGIETCTIDPEPENQIAIHSYRNAGFRHVRTYHSDQSGVDVYLMRLDRQPDD